MSNISTLEDKNMLAVESALVRNDISALTTQERLTFYNKICESVGLNPLTKPFSFLRLQGKEVLYANKDCTEQLRKIHGVSTQIISKGLVGDLYEVHVKARDKSGKEDDDLAYVVVKGLSGNDLANAMLKAVTKAKRRVTLSICGLGILDISEIETIADVSSGSNPQFENPFKTKDVSQIQEPIPESSLNDDLGEFVCRVGKKHIGKKLSDFDIFELNNFIESTKKWFEEEERTPSDSWKEFFEVSEAYLKSREMKTETESL